MPFRTLGGVLFWEDPDELSLLRDADAAEGLFHANLEYLLVHHGAETAGHKLVSL